MFSEPSPDEDTVRLSNAFVHDCVLFSLTQDGNRTFFQLHNINEDDQCASKTASWQSGAPLEVEASGETWKPAACSGYEGELVTNDLTVVLASIHTPQSSSVDKEGLFLGKLTFDFIYPGKVSIFPKDEETYSIGTGPNKK